MATEKKDIVKTETAGFVSEDASPHNSRSKYVLYVLTVIALVLFGLLVWKGLQANQTVKTASKLCSSPELGQKIQSAITEGRSDNKDPYSSVMAEIKQIKSYDTQAKCLYPFVRYYALIDDLPQAKLYLTKFDAVYESSDKTPYVPGGSTLSQKELHNYVAFAEKNHINAARQVMGD